VIYGALHAMREPAVDDERRFEGCPGRDSNPYGLATWGF
jgi:hypothetical protein